MFEEVWKIIQTGIVSPDGVGADSERHLIEVDGVMLGKDEASPANSHGAASGGVEFAMVSVKSVRRKLYISNCGL